MKSFFVTASYSVHLHTVIKADSKDEADEKAYSMLRNINKDEWNINHDVHNFQYKVRKVDG